MTIADIDPGADVSEISPPWARELETWRSFPALSPVWDDIDAFIEEIRAVAAAKVAEREAGRTALREALEQLCREFSAELDYFEVNVESWRAEAVAWHEAESTALHVGRLHDEMGNHRSLQARPAAHYSEARRLREEINAVEDSIFGHIAALDERFAVNGESGNGTVLRAESPPALKLAVVSEPEPGAADTLSELPPLETVEALDSVEQMGVAVVEEAPVVAQAPPDPALDESALHRPLAVHGWYSPLTSSQEEAILAPGSGAGLVFASGALGFEHLPEAVTRLAASVDGGIYTAISPLLATGGEFYEALRTVVEANPRAGRIIAAQPIVVASADIVERIDSALKFVKDHPDVTVRVLFFLAPGAVSTWLELPPAKRKALEARLEPVIHLATWSADAVEDRLAREGKLRDEETVALAMDATGGWSWCVDKLFEICGEASDPRSAIDETLTRLTEGDLREEFLQRLGVKPDSVPVRVMDLVASEGEVLSDLVCPELVGGNVTADSCRQALDFLQAVGCARTNEGVVRLDPFVARLLKAA